MSEQELQEFFEKFKIVVGEKQAIEFFKTAKKSMDEKPKKFKNNILFASKIL